MMLAAALKSRSLVLQAALQPLKLGFTGLQRSISSTSNAGFLDLNEVERILHDVKADDVQVIPVKDQCGWTDYVVIATGRSTWHVRNIAEALIYKVKQKQEGVERKLLPSVEGHQGGKWIVIDSGKVTIHALDENARAYYNLESLWTADSSKQGQIEDLDKVLVKIRRKNNSKKPMLKCSMLERWHQWVNEYKKSYKDSDEHDRRFNIFKTNVEYIDSFNARNKTSKLGTNQFADLTNEEINERYVGGFKLSSKC